MNSDRLIKTAIILLVVGTTGQFAVRSVAQQGNMGMMNGMNCMMGNSMPQGIDPQLLPDANSEGTKLLIKYCSQCHGVPGPGLHIATEWPDVVARMNHRMQMMSRGRMMMNIEAPSESELKTLMAYLEKNAQKTISPDKLAGMDTADGQAFQKICTQCHALPDPAQHSGSEWPAVIERMRVNMSSMGKQLPDQTTTDLILNFLQTHSVK